LTLKIVDKNLDARENASECATLMKQYRQCETISEVPTENEHT